MTIDATTVYWTVQGASNGMLMKCASAGCASSPTTLVSGQSYAGAIAVDATSVYWGSDIHGGTIAKMPK